jgi:hypothetical protein
MEREALDVFLLALNHPQVKSITTLSGQLEQCRAATESVSGDTVPGAEESDRSVYLPGRNILLFNNRSRRCLVQHARRFRESEAVASIEYITRPTCAPSIPIRVSL